FDSAPNDDWVTDVDRCLNDALLEKTANGWLVKTPLSKELIEISAHRKGMDCVGRILQSTGSAVPSALLGNPHLLAAFTNRPPYQKLFKRVAQKLVRIDRSDF